MTTAKKLLTAFEEFRPHINGHTTAINLFLEAVDEVSDLQDTLNTLRLNDVVVPKGTLFCDKENKECKYLRKKNKCGLRKRWCSYQTK